MNGNSSNETGSNQQVGRKHNLSPVDHTPLDASSILPSQISDLIAERKRIIINLKKRIAGMSDSSDLNSPVRHWSEILAKHERDLCALLERESSLLKPKTKKRRMRLEYEDSENITSQSSMSSYEHSVTIYDRSNRDILEVIIRLEASSRSQNRTPLITIEPTYSAKNFVRNFTNPKDLPEQFFHSQRQQPQGLRPMDIGNYNAALQSFGVELDLSNLQVKTRPQDEQEALRNERKELHSEIMSKIKEAECDYKLLLVSKEEVAMPREMENSISSLLSSEAAIAEKLETPGRNFRFEYEHAGSQQGGMVIRIKTPQTYALLKAASESGNFYITSYPSLALKASLSVSVPFANVSSSDIIKLIGKSEYDFKTWTHIRAFRNPAPKTSRHFFLVGKKDVLKFASKHITQSFKGRNSPNEEYAIINERTPSGAAAYLSIRIDQLLGKSITPAEIWNESDLFQFKRSQKILESLHGLMSRPRTSTTKPWTSSAWPWKGKSHWTTHSPTKNTWNRIISRERSKKVLVNHKVFGFSSELHVIKIGDNKALVMNNVFSNYKKEAEEGSVNVGREANFLFLQLSSGQVNFQKLFIMKAIQKPKTDGSSLDNFVTHTYGMAEYASFVEHFNNSGTATGWNSPSTTEIFDFLEQRNVMDIRIGERMDEFIKGCKLKPFEAEALSIKMDRIIEFTRQLARAERSNELSLVIEDLTKQLVEAKSTGLNASESSAQENDFKLELTIEDLRKSNAEKDEAINNLRLQLRSMASLAPESSESQIKPKSESIQKCHSSLLSMIADNKIKIEEDKLTRFAFVHKDYPKRIITKAELAAFESCQKEGQALGLIIHEMSLYCGGLRFGVKSHRALTLFSSLISLRDSLSEFRMVEANAKYLSPTANIYAPSENMKFDTMKLLMTENGFDARNWTLLREKLEGGTVSYTILTSAKDIIKLASRATNNKRLHQASGHVRSFFSLGSNRNCIKMEAYSSTVEGLTTSIYFFGHSNLALQNALAKAALRPERRQRSRKAATSQWKCNELIKILSCRIFAPPNKFTEITKSSHIVNKLASFNLFSRLNSKFASLLSIWRTLDSIKLK